MRARAYLVGLLCLAGACGPKAAPKPKVPPIPPPAKLGEACKPGEGMAQSNCASGLLCMPAGGGFCTSMCPCGEGGAVCGQSTLAPELCYRSCNEDKDCGGGGLTCDQEHKACAPAGLLAPKPPACTAPALARGVFGKVNQLSKAGKANYEPTVALDKDDNLVAVYLNGILVGPNAMAATKVTVGKESSVGEADHAIAIDRENAADPWLARGAGGKLYLTYLGFNGGGAPEKNMMVGLATSDDGLNWNKAVVANDVASDCPGDAPGCLDKPIVVVGPNRLNEKSEVIYVFYFSAITNGLRATHSNDGGLTFSPSAKVGDGAQADAEVTSSGKVHVVFVGGGGNKMGDAQNGVFYASSGDGGENFSAPVRISAASESVPFFFSSPRVVVDVPRRLLYAVYTSGTPDGKWDVVLATSRDAGLTWSQAKVNDDAGTPCASHMLPAATLDPATGKVHVVWLDNRSGAGAVAYAACAPGGDKCGKNEQVNDAPFAAFGYARHAASTLGDYISIAVDPKKKLVHAVWAQPIDEGGTIVSRVFQASAKAGK